MTKITALLALVTAVAISGGSTLSGQQHERRIAAAQASSEVHAVAGGTRFTLPYSIDKVFPAIVRNLNSSGTYTVDEANRESGLIATAMEIKGGWKQTGTRIVITVINDTATTTMVRVAATVQKRYKALQTEPWSDPKVDDQASAGFAQKLQTALTNDLSNL